MIHADQHTHSSFSTDSQASPEEMLQGAITKGLTHLCLTDHMDLDYPTDKPYQEFVFDPKKYFAALTPLKEKYAGTLNLSIGVELGLRPNRPDLNAQLHRLLSDFPFDFVLGSIHLLDNDDPYYESYWTSRSVSNVLSKYFDAMLSSLHEFDNFDSLGHLDYLIRYIPTELGPKDYVYKEYREVIDEILAFLVRKDKAMEINTAGLIKGLSCFHPKKEVLTRYLELGGQLLTIGSDGHAPDKIATEFTQTEELLRSCGVKGYYIYQNRIAQFVPF